MSTAINSIQAGANTQQLSFQTVMKQVQADSKALADALNNGNLTDAQAAFGRLQKNVPPGAGGANDPMSAKIDSLGKALNSGDLKAAQTAFADIRNSAPQGPGGPGRGPRPGGAGAPPPGSNAPSGQSAESSSGASSKTVYDPRDTNQDGTVSTEEAQTYALKHPDTKQLSSFSAWA